MSEIRTLEEFKKNLQLIESRLSSNDLCDPTEDLVKMKTWIDHVQLAEADPQYRQYLIREGLPKVVKAVLKRRYSNNDTHVTMAASFLQDAAKFAAQVLRDTPNMVDVQFSLLTELFDPKQPFYQKYGHTKAVIGGMNAVDVTTVDDAPHVDGINRELNAAHATFLNELEEGSCFDYLYAPGKWELAIIEGVSTTRERFNISFPEKGKTEWLTISEHKDKMAPYMTKVKTMGMNDNAVMMEDAMNPTVIHGEIQGGNGTSMDGETEMWRFNVAPGMLIDAKDLQNNWYQACIMEVKHEPVPPVVPILNLPTAPKSILKLKLKGANSSDNDNNNGSNITTPVKKSGRKCVVIDPKTAANDPLYDATNNVWPVGDGVERVSPYGIGNDERDIYCHQTTSSLRKDDDPSSPIEQDKVSADDLNIVGHMVGPEDVNSGEDDKPGMEEKMDVSDDDDDNVSIDTVAPIVVEGSEATGTDLVKFLENVTGSETNGADLLKFLEKKAKDGRDLTTALCEVCTTTTASATTRVGVDETLLTASPMNVKAVVRVSFIGWGEHYDAWIDVDSDRIAQFNSKSAGRRGDSAVREEIIYFITHSSISSMQPMTNAGQNDNTSMNISEGIAVASVESNDQYATMGTEHQGCFHSQHLVNIVNVFGRENGFDRIMSILNWARGHIVADSSLIPHTSWKPPSQLCLSLVICVGYLHRVLTPPKCRLIADDNDSDPESMGFFPCTAFLMRNVGVQELREITVETFESALCGLEALAIACYTHAESSSSFSSFPSSSSSDSSTEHHLTSGRKRAGLLVESLWVDVSLRYLTCPYLNRRLGGLKMLSDMLKRAQATIDHPTGLQIIRLSPPANPDNVCYRVISTFAHLTLDSLCQRIQESGVIPLLFRGEQAHESLMLRAGELLRVLALSRRLDMTVLDALWDAGFHQREAAALACLVDVIHIMEAGPLMKLLQATLYAGSPSYTNASTASGTVNGNGSSSSGSTRHTNNSNGNIKISHVNTSVFNGAFATGGVLVPIIDGATVTEHVVDVVAALATRARTLLLSPQTLLQDGGSGTSTASSTAASLTVIDASSLTTIDSTGEVRLTDGVNTTEHGHDDAIRGDGDMGTPAMLPLEFELHEHTVRLLWQWSRDGSGVSDLAALRSLMKLEQVILGSTGTTSANNSGLGGGNSSVAVSGGLLVLPSVYADQGGRSLLMQETLYLRHYQRCRWLVDLAMRDVEQGCSVLPAVRVLQAYISSWPAGKEDSSGGVRAGAIGVRLGLGMTEHKTGMEGESMDVDSSSSTTSSSSSSSTDPSTVPSSLLPFPPTRGGVVTHLEESHSVLHKITAAVVCMKRQFNAAIRSIEIDSGAVVPLEIQEVFNEMMIGGESIGGKDGDGQVQGSGNNPAVSRVGYKDQLEKLLDFCHMFVRCTTLLVISQACIEAFWYKVVCQASTQAESDAVMNFMMRMVIRNEATATHTHPLPADAVSTENNAIPIHSTIRCRTTQKRKAACEVGVVRWMFEELLCSYKHTLSSSSASSASSSSSSSSSSFQFISSPFFSTTAFECVEKLFRWLNGEAGLLVLTNKEKTMNGAGSATSTQFLIVGPPSRLIGMDVFLDVIMRCVSDTVASKAIAFITALPSRLAPHLTGLSLVPGAATHTPSEGGNEKEVGQEGSESHLTGDEELTALRTLLLEQCTSQLSLTQGLGVGNAQGQGLGSGSDNGDDLLIAAAGRRDQVLKRLLKLLNSLLEESLGDLGTLRPHGGLARGYDINITVTGANKFKDRSGALVLHSNCTISDLLATLGRQFQRDPSHLKVFRCAKELGLPGDRAKTLAQMRFNCSSSTDQLMVTERLPVHGPTPDPTLTSPQRVKASSPAMLLSSNPHHFNMLFDLLGSATDPTIVDELWALIRRLPAPFPLLQHWVNLDEGKSVLDMLLRSSPLPTTTTTTNTTTKPSALPSLPLLPTHCLARLLYHLEIIEALLEPACLSKPTESSAEGGGAGVHTNTSNTTTTADTSSISSSSGSSTPASPPGTVSDALLAMGYDCVDPHRVAIWPAAFLAKGGLKALLQVYEWLATSLKREGSAKPLSHSLGQGKHDSSSNNDGACMREEGFHGPGTSPVMILRAIDLTVRLVRAFYVRACVCTVPVPSALSMLQHLEHTRITRTQTTTPTKPSTTSSSSPGNSSVSAGTGGLDRMIGPSLPPSMVVDKESHFGENSQGAVDYSHDAGGGVISFGPQHRADSSTGSTSQNGVHLLDTNSHQHKAHLGTNDVPLASVPGLPGGDDTMVPPLLQEADIQMTAIYNLLGKEWGNGVVPPGSMGDKVWTLLSLRVKAIDAAAVQSASMALLTLIQDLSHISLFDEEAYVDNSDKIAVAHRQKTAVGAMDSILAVWAGAVALQPSILCTLAQTPSLATPLRDVPSSDLTVRGCDDKDHDHSSWAGLQTLLALLLLPRTSNFTDASTALSTSGSTPTSVVSLPRQIAEWTSGAFRAILTLSSHIDDGDNDDTVRKISTTNTNTNNNDSAMTTTVTGAVRNHNLTFLSMQQHQQASLRSQCTEEKDAVYDDDVYEEDNREDKSRDAGHDRQMGVHRDIPSDRDRVFTTLQWRLFRSLWSLRPPLLLNEPMPHIPSSVSSGSGRSDIMNDEGEVGKHVFALLLAVVEGPPPRSPVNQRQGLKIAWTYRRKLCDELFQELRRASASAHTLPASIRSTAVEGTLSLLRCLLLPYDSSSSSSSSSSMTMVMHTTTPTTATTTTITTHHTNGFSQGTIASNGSTLSGGDRGGGDFKGNSRPSSTIHDSSPSHNQDVVASHELLHHFVVDKGLLCHLMVDCLGFVSQDTFLSSLAASQLSPHPYHTHHQPLSHHEGYTSLPFAGLHPLCADEPSKKAAFALLLSLCHWRPALIDDVFRLLQPVIASLPALSVWDYKPSRETRSSTGFVGLKNKGCTCYMNSLLQVLYMIPEIREGLLDAPIAPHSSDYQKNNDLVLQLQKLFVYLKYTAKKAYSPDDWVYAYKDEMGIMPVNCMVQQDAQEFFQVLCERLEHAHSAGRSVKSVTGVGIGIGSGGTVSGVGELLKHSFGGKICNQMLKDTAGGMSSSGVGGSVGLDECAMVVDDVIGGREDGSDNSHYVAMDIGGGVGAAIGINGDGCISSNVTVDAANLDVREQEDPFVCLSLQVKDAKGLEDSLLKFVQGEQISDYKWDDHGPRVNIIKRQCLSQLSDTLMFHLKRFELNFDTFRREKVNDAFPFPKFLNMYSYTKEGLTSPEGTGQGQGSSQSTATSSGSPTSGGGRGGVVGVDTTSPRPPAYYQYELAGVVVHTGTTDSGHYYAYIKDNWSLPIEAKTKGISSAATEGIQTEGGYQGDGVVDAAAVGSSSLQQQQQPPSSLSDDSKGVGKASSPASRIGKEGCRWLEFNDSEVTEFLESRLDAECFGGTTISHDFHKDTKCLMTEETVNPKSAYMLVYRRSQPLGEGWALARQLAAPAETKQNQGYTHKTLGLDEGLNHGLNKDAVTTEEVDVSNDVTGGNGVLMGIYDRSKHQSMRGPLKKLIQEDNAVHALTVRLIDPLVISTVQCLLKEATSAVGKTMTATTTAASVGGMAVNMGAGGNQPISSTPPDLSLTTVSPTLCPHPPLSVGLSLTAFETALVLNMRLFAHSPAASGVKGIFDELSAAIAQVVANAKAEKTAWRKAAHAHRADHRAGLGSKGEFGARSDVTIMEIEGEDGDEKAAEAGVDAGRGDQGVGGVFSAVLSSSMGPMLGPGPALGPGLKTLTRQGSPTEPNLTPSKRARLGKNNHHHHNGGHMDNMSMDMIAVEGGSDGRGLGLGQVVDGQGLAVREGSDAAVYPVMMGEDVNNEDDEEEEEEDDIFVESFCHADALASLLCRLLVVDQPIATKNTTATDATTSDSITTSGGGLDSTAMMVTTSDNNLCLDTSSSSSSSSSSTSSVSPIDTTFQLLYAPDKDTFRLFAVIDAVEEEEEEEDEDLNIDNERVEAGTAMTGVAGVTEGHGGDEREDSGVKGEKEHGVMKGLGCADSFDVYHDVRALVLEDLMNKAYAQPMNQGTLVASGPQHPPLPLPPLSERTYHDALNHNNTEQPTAGAGLGGTGLGTIGNGDSFVGGTNMTTEEEQLQMAIRLSMEINQPPPPPPLNTSDGNGTSSASEGNSDSKGLGRSTSSSILSAGSEFFSSASSAMMAVLTNIGHPHEKTTPSSSSTATQGTGPGSEQGQNVSTVIDKVVLVDSTDGGGGDVHDSGKGLGSVSESGQGLRQEAMDVVGATLHSQDDGEKYTQSLALKAQQEQLEHFNKTNNSNHKHNTVEGGRGLVEVGTSGGGGNDSIGCNVNEGVNGGMKEGVRSAVNRTSMLRRGPRLLLELTRDQRMQLIAEHWRRAEAFTWLLKEIAKMGDEGGATYITHCMLETTTSSSADSLRHHNHSSNPSDNVIMADTNAHNVSTDTNTGELNEPFATATTTVSASTITASTTTSTSDDHTKESSSLFGAVPGVDGSRARAHRSFLIRRQVICQLVDIFTADQSPAKNTWYTPGTRRTAPSSYVSIPPPILRHGPLVAASRNIPDWTDLLETLRLLVCTGTNEGMETGTGVPPTLFVPYPTAKIPWVPMAWSAPRLDQGSYLCLAARTMYSIALRQGRYSQALIPLIVHLSHGSNTFSDMIAELLFEEFVQCTAETTSHLFAIMEAFLSIQDHLTNHRAMAIFRAETGPMSLLKTIHNQSSKAKLICVSIRSLMTLAQRVKTVKELLTENDFHIKTWAPWMLKFSFQFSNLCQKEATEAATAKATIISNNTTTTMDNIFSTTDNIDNGLTGTKTSTTSTSSSTSLEVEKGPYLVVYGESDEESEDTWVARAEKTNQMLSSFLLSVNAQPDALIPEDTFTTMLLDNQNNNGTHMDGHGHGGQGLDHGSSITHNNGTFGTHGIGTANNPVPLFSDSGGNGSGQNEFDSMPALISEDTISWNSVTPPLIPVVHRGATDKEVTFSGIGNGSLDDNGFVDFSGGLQDGMSDEQLAAYLASMED